MYITCVIGGWWPPIRLGEISTLLIAYHLLVFLMLFIRAKKRTSKIKY